MKTAEIPVVDSIEILLSELEQEFNKKLASFNEQAKKFFEFLLSEFEVELKPRPSKHEDYWLLKSHINRYNIFDSRVMISCAFLDCCLHFWRLSPSVSERTPSQQIYLHVKIYVNRKGLFEVRMTNRGFESEETDHLDHSFKNLSSIEVFDLIPKMKEYLGYRKY